MDGIEALYNIPIKLLLNYLMKFNQGRNLALRFRLIEI